MSFLLLQDLICGLYMASCIQTGALRAADNQNAGHLTGI